MVRTRSVRRWIAALAAVVFAITGVGVATAGPPTGGALPPQLTQIVGIAGVGEVPIDAVGVALNVTVTNPAAAGYVTVHPCRDPAPVASNLNYVADQTVPNFVVAGLDVDGDVCITTNSVTDVIVDVAGYVPAGSPIVPLVEPVRFLDTREGLGVPRTRVGGGQVLTVPVAGTSGVPTNAGTVIFNTTVVSPSAPGFVTAFPCGQPLPATSSVNYVAGGVVPNLTIAAVGTGGSVCLYTTAETDLVADVAAYVPAGASGLTMLASPQRILDTRIGLGGPAAAIGNDVRPVQVGGVAGVPSGATAALVNLTATEAADAGFAAAFPCGVGVPLVSNLNFGRGQNVANAAVVKLAADGTMCLTANERVHAVVDVAGYVMGASALVPVTPRRLLDTREGVEPRCGIGVERSRSTRHPYFPVLVDSYRFHTFATGAVATPQIAFSYWNSKAFVMADCRITVLMEDYPGQAMLWNFDRTGALVGYPGWVIPAWSLAADVVASDDFLFGLSPADEVVELVSREPLFGLPDLGLSAEGVARDWSLIGVSDDASVFALSAHGADGSLGEQYDVYLLDASGGLLDAFPTPAGVAPISVTSDLVYVLVSDRSGGGPPRYGLWTTTPQEVASFTATTGRDTLEAIGFASDGVVNVCTSGSTPRARRWDLFTPVGPYASDATLPCFLDVG